MKRLFLKTILLFIFTQSAFSQSIDQSVISELSESEIQLLKSEFIDNNNFQEEPKNISNTESLQNNDEISEIVYGNKFGYSYFNTIPTNILASSDLPLPNEYKISLNDQFTVLLTGSKEEKFDLNVNLDGTILFPELGSVSVAGETFQEVKQKLNNLIQQAYVGVQIDISLKNLSAKKISIVGAVNTPGTYLVNPFTTITSSLAYSGGVSPIGSLRNIKLIRNNNKVYTFDLYDLLIRGDRTNDITIESGDVILVQAAKQFVSIGGEVKRPLVYEIKNGEKISDLLQFALGLSYPNLEKISITKIDPNTNNIFQKNINVLDYSLQNVIDVTMFGFNPINKKSNVFVNGAVLEPGYYEISSNQSLESLINDIKFVNVYPWAAIIEQFDEKNLINSSTMFSLKDPTTYKDINVLPGSKIFFISSNSRNFSDISQISNNLVSQYSISINHRGEDYLLPVIGRFKVMSLVNLLGLDTSTIDDQVVFISPLENDVTIGDYRSMELNASKYSRLSFRSSSDDLIKVTISGAVEYPGEYILKPDATLNDLYGLVGNFKKEAFIDGIIFTRESVRDSQIFSIETSQKALRESMLISSLKNENIGDISLAMELSSNIDTSNLGRIAGDFTPNSISSINTTLFDGDRIIIPKNPNVINVLGEVLNPTSFEYSDRLNVNKAISLAGGYKDYAKKSGVYVIKSNGLIEKSSRNIFTQNIKLEPGDTIIVPRKIITNNPGIDALIPITQILSDFAFSAAAIESLSKN